MDVDPEVAAQLEEHDPEEILLNPEDEDCDMFDEMIAQAREQGSDDEFDEMHGTGETIGASDPAIVWQRFLESTGAYAGDDNRTMPEDQEYGDFSDNEAQFSDDVSLLLYRTDSYHSFRMTTNRLVSLRIR